MTTKDKPTETDAADDAVAVGDVDAVTALQARIREMEAAGRINLRDTPGDQARTETGMEARARQRALQANLNTRWAERLPVMFADASMDDLEGQDRNLLTWRSREASLTLVIAGPVGTGKTHAAYAIGNAAVAHGTWAEAWTTTDLLEALRPGGDPHLAYRVRHCDLLVLDDLGAGKATDWAVETLTAIMDHRLREQRRQVITTNHPYDVLVEAWGRRLLDRIQYRWTAVTMTGESRRKVAPW